MRKLAYRWLLTGVILLFLLLMAACSTKHYSLVRGDKLFFYYQVGRAEEVIFASSIDQYKYHPATSVRDGLWEVAVPPVLLGEDFSYFYIVDGLVTLPACPFTVGDDFGAKNCLYLSTM